MRTVFLDLQTIRPTDLDLTALKNACTELKTYDSTTPVQVIERIRNAECVISNKVHLGRTELSAAPQLKLICVAATGTNNVDLAAAHELGITVCNAQSYSTESVAQHTFSLLLMLATNMQHYADDVQNGAWSQSAMFCLLNHPIVELSGKTLGIVGYGAIGQRVAHIAKAFGMRVLIAGLPGRESVGRLPLDAMLPECDVVSIHCPLTEGTKNLFDRVRISKMKPDAWMINVGRGGIVNETDLLAALRDKTIAAAALDVLAQEPPATDHPLLKAKQRNLLITPHNAWASSQARQNLVRQIAENINHYRAGATVRTIQYKYNDAT